MWCHLEQSIAIDLTTRRLQKKNEKRSDFFFVVVAGMSMLSSLLTGSFVSFPFWCVSIDVHVLKTYSPHDSSKRNQQQKNCFFLWDMQRRMGRYNYYNNKSARHTNRNSSMHVNGKTRHRLRKKKSIGLNKWRLMCACACMRNGQNAFSRSWKQNA